MLRLYIVYTESETALEAVSIMTAHQFFLLFALASGLAAGCQFSGRKADEAMIAGPAFSESGAFSHHRLVADHHQMEASHHRMAAADSAMEARHAAALTLAQAKHQDQWPVFQVLETRHRAFMKLHQRVMRHHAEVLARHAALETAHASGTVSNAQMRVDHATMQAEDEQMQQEHRRLLAEHQQMEQEHTTLLQAVAKTR